MGLCTHTSLQAQPPPTGSLGSPPSLHPPIYLCVPQERLDASPTVSPRHDEQRAALLQAPLPFSFTPHTFLFLHPTYLCKLHFFFFFFFQESKLWGLFLVFFFRLKAFFNSVLRGHSLLPSCPADEILFAAYKHHGQDPLLSKFKLETGVDSWFKQLDGSPASSLPAFTLNYVCIFWRLPPAPLASSQLLRAVSAFAHAPSSPRKLCPDLAKEG